MAILAKRSLVSRVSWPGCDIQSAEALSFCTFQCCVALLWCHICWATEVKVLEQFHLREWCEWNENCKSNVYIARAKKSRSVASCSKGIGLALALEWINIDDYFHQKKQGTMVTFCSTTVNSRPVQARGPTANGMNAYLKMLASDDILCPTNDRQWSECTSRIVEYQCMSHRQQQWPLCVKSKQSETTHSVCDIFLGGIPESENNPQQKITTVQRFKSSNLCGAPCSHLSGRKL